MLAQVSLLLGTPVQKTLEVWTFTEEKQYKTKRWIDDKDFGREIKQECSLRNIPWHRAYLTILFIHDKKRHMQHNLWCACSYNISFPRSEMKANGNIL